jgi:hypothetical protein
MQFNAPNIVDIINLFFRNQVVSGVGFHDCSAEAKLDLIVIVEEVEGAEPAAYAIQLQAFLLQASHAPQVFFPCGSLTFNIGEWAGLD